MPCGGSPFEPDARLAYGRHVSADGTNIRGVTSIFF